MQYEGDGCWMYNPFDDYDIALKPAPSSEPVPLDHSRGSVEDKIAYQEMIANSSLPDYLK